MYIKRELENKIYKYFNKPEILAVIGPRQSGKTTLLKEVFKKCRNSGVYIDFEDREKLDLFNNDIKSFYSLYGKKSKYLFIDEFQYAAEGGKQLKYLYDTHKIKIIISGSSALDLTHQAIKYLVGRIFIFHLYPFSFSEFLSYRDSSLYQNIYCGLKRKINEYIFSGKKSFPAISVEIIRQIIKYYHEYVIYGGYPRVVLAEDNEEKEVVLRNIYNTYFLREIRDILQLSTEGELQKLIKALSLQAGSMVEYNELGRISGFNYISLQKHLNILEKTFVIKKILPFCTNKRTEIAKSPKIYFFDNGFRNVSISNFQRLSERVDRGSLNENFVASQLLKEERSINYWRTKSSAEIDFVIEKEGKKIAIEVKSTLHSNKAGKALISFKEKYAPYRAVVLSENYFYSDKRKDILFLPLFFM